MSITCSLYGLGLQVNVTLNGLVGLPVAKSVDVTVDFCTDPSNLDSVFNRSDVFEDFYAGTIIDNQGTPEFRAARSVNGEVIRLTYSDNAVFLIDKSGSRVNIIMPVGMIVEEAAPCLLGPIMGVVLRLRGVSCLHASSVVIDNQAIALIGVSGAGKSTSAAAFARLGYSVLGDDVLALTDCRDHFLVRPAYPRVRLWPESVEGLFGNVNALPRMTPGWDKRFLGLKNPGYHFQEQPVQLAAAYFLQPRVLDSAFPAISTVSPAAALMSLVADSYATNFLDKSLRAKEFEVLSRLVQSVPLRSIAAPNDLARIDSFCEAVVQDVRSLGARRALRMSVA